MTVIVRRDHTARSSRTVKISTSNGATTQLLYLVQCVPRSASVRVCVCAQSIRQCFPPPLDAKRDFTMQIFVAVVVAVVCCFAAAARAAQFDLSATSAATADAPVKYDGAQLWRVPFDALPERNAVADLQNSFGECSSQQTPLCVRFACRSRPRDRRRDRSGESLA